MRVAAEGIFRGMESSSFLDAYYVCQTMKKCLRTGEVSDCSSSEKIKKERRTFARIRIVVVGAKDDVPKFAGLRNRPRLKVSVNPRTKTRWCTHDTVAQLEVLQE